MVEVHCCGSLAASSPLVASPALFIRISSRPSWSMVFPTIASHCRYTVTSHGRAAARRPRARTSPATASISAALRALTAMSAPSVASASAAALPMPRPPPVINATRPASFMSPPFQALDVGLWATSPGDVRLTRPGASCCYLFSISYGHARLRPFNHVHWHSQLEGAMHGSMPICIRGQSHFGVRLLRSCSSCHREHDAQVGDEGTHGVERRLYQGCPPAPGCHVSWVQALPRTRRQVLHPGSSGERHPTSASGAILMRA